MTPGLSCGVPSVFYGTRSSSFHLEDCWFRAEWKSIGRLQSKSIAFGVVTLRRGTVAIVGKTNSLLNLTLEVLEA